MKKEAFDVWFTMGTNNDGLVVSWGEPHLSESLAVSAASIGNPRYTKIHVVQYRTNDPRQLFETLRHGQQDFE